MLLPVPGGPSRPGPGLDDQYQRFLQVIVCRFMSPASLTTNNTSDEMKSNTEEETIRKFQVGCRPEGEFQMEGKSEGGLEKERGGLEREREMRGGERGRISDGGRRRLVSQLWVSAVNI